MITRVDMTTHDILRHVQWACSLMTYTGCDPAQRTHCCRDRIICRLFGCAAQWCPLFTTITPARAELVAHSVTLPTFFLYRYFVSLLAFLLIYCTMYGMLSVYKSLEICSALSSRHIRSSPGTWLVPLYVSLYSTLYSSRII
jgi:hypothetical protein